MNVQQDWFTGASGRCRRRQACSLKCCQKAHAQCSKKCHCRGSAGFVFKPLKAQVFSSLAASLRFGVDVAEFHHTDSALPSFLLILCTHAPFFSAEEAYHEQVTEITCLSVSPLPRWSSALPATEGPHSSHSDDGKRGIVRHWLL